MAEQVGMFTCLHLRSLTCGVATAAIWECGVVGMVVLATAKTGQAIASHRIFKPRWY